MRGLIQLCCGAALAAVLAIAPTSCACNETKKTGTTTTAPHDAGSGTTVATATACDDVKARIESLYRAEAKQDDKHAELSIADNTAMVLADCRTNPVAFAACINGAADVAALERDCLIPLDDEGRAEGRAFGGK